ncbi:HpcH/HpaI aldolase/citrate lyase family protein [Lachnoanaerobaculum umeaense]|jgi:putative ATP/GTP-binding protein|uniref:ATP/GTP-binding protein n=1 Tax=Lachnoanaerobaculum umeaense TaxID=617123 RepID=A0A385PX77_9FIRM|nr:HpcH/HpaI aldolase/citrate lyase family protein [Lachnoanaerobaculum umeaense]AYA98602.1 ATP/GTP-binding protein [Lachnoanaerobaculum umeaense]PZW97872.1 C-C bond lyase family protein [Lachnoanaerobaculum umeaense]
MKDSSIYYSVGALLYTAANDTNILDDIILEKFNIPFSLAFSFDTTSNDAEADKAENILIKTLDKLFVVKKDRNFYIPKLFIKVLSTSHITHLYKKFGSLLDLITGFILPDFSVSNADVYIYEMQRINSVLSTPVYILPELDCMALLDLRNRYNHLYAIKEKLSSYEDYILNILVSTGNILNMLCVRHKVDENIYQSGPVAKLLSDIVTTFSSDYIISAPAFEYYAGIGWQEGLVKEIELDKLHGFIGKTIVHPKQILVLNDAYKVPSIDYDDALNVLDDKKIYQTCPNVNNTRINEPKIHYNWAMEIILLAQYFGVKKY